MNNPENSIARIFGAKGEVVGAGCLLSENLVITCTHVLKAISSSADLAMPVTLDFPLVESRDKISGRVIFMELGKDIACIDVTGLVPKGTAPANLAIADNLWGNTFRTFGFPAGYINGVWSSGVLRSKTGEGWLQIEDIKDTGYSIQPGFSGGPVWDDQLKAVIGIVTAAEMDQSIKVAFCIPSRELITVYPALRQNAVMACPYRSLDAFEEYDGMFFFGRDRVISKLLDNLKREPRFLAVLGPSGSGKSSVVKAGLIPALKDGKVPGSNRWQVSTIRPGLQPFAQLEAVGLADPSLSLAASVSEWLTKHPHIQRFVIFIDQFEELLVSTPEIIKHDFIAEIARLLESPNPCTIILALRDDFYSRFQQEATPLANWLERGLVNIPPTLETHELYDIIVKPSQQVGINFEEGLVENIIHDAVDIDRTQASAKNTILPLLEFALAQMWELQRGNTLTHHDYFAIGGVSGGLSQWADKAYYSLDPNERLATRTILTALVNLGDESQGIPNTKRFKSYAELGHDQAAKQVIQKLVQARLLVAGFDISSRQDQIEIIHEALIYKWSQLAKWIEEDREYLNVFNQFAESAKEWDMAGRDRELLYRGGRLDRLLQLLEKRNAESLNILEQEFLKQSETQEAITRENERIARATQERASLLEALTDVATTLTSSLKTEELIASLPTLLERIIPFDTATLWIRDDDRMTIAALASSAPTLKHIDMEISATNNALFSEMISSGQGIMIGDVKLDPRISYVEEPCLSWLGFPLVSKSLVIGVLALEKNQLDFFTHEHVQIGSTFASQAAIALENARLFQESLRRATELTERSERLALLNRLSSGLAGSLDTGQVLRFTANQLMGAMHADRSMIILLDQADQISLFLALPDETSRSTNHGPIPDSPVFSKMRESPTVYVTDDVRTDPDLGTFKDYLEDAVSLMILPIFSSFNLYAISIQSNKPGHFATTEIELARTVSNQTSMALENASLYQSTIANAERLVILNQFSLDVSANLDLEDIYRSIHDAASKLISLDTFVIAFPDEKQDEVEGVYVVNMGQRIYGVHQPKGQGLIGQVLVTGQTILIYQFGDVETQDNLVFGKNNLPISIIAVPMISGGEVIGALSAQCYLDNAYSENDRQILSTLANQAVVAIQNARLLTETQKLASTLEQRVIERTAELEHEQRNTETLLRILTEVSASLDLDRALSRTLALLNESVGAEQGTIMLLNHEDNMLHYRAGYGYITQDAQLSKQLITLKFKIGEGLAGWVVKNRQPVLVDDISADSRWVVSQGSQNHRSAVVAPLTVDQDVIGVIMVFHRRTGYFNDASLEMVKAIGSQVAISINNAQLYELIRDQAERLGFMLHRQQQESSRQIAVMDAVADGVVVMDPSNEISFVNASAERILSVSATRLVGESIENVADLFGTTAQAWVQTVKQWSQNPTENHESEIYVDEISLENGKTVLVHLSLVILQNDFLGTVSIFRELNNTRT